MSSLMSGHLLEIIVALAVIVVLTMIGNRSAEASSGETDNFIKNFEPGILKGSIDTKPGFTCKEDGGKYSYEIDMKGVSLNSAEEEIKFRAFAEFAGPKTGHSLIALSKSSGAWEGNDNSFLYTTHDAKTGLYAVQKFDPKKIGTPKVFARVTLWRESTCVTNNFPIENHAVKTKEGRDATSVDVLNACAASYLSAFDIPATIINNQKCNQGVCKLYNYDSCVNVSTSFGLCYYDGSCNGCTIVEDCSKINSIAQCGPCAVTGSKCSWMPYNECIDPTKARTLSVKADPGDAPIEIWEFRFSKGSGAEGKCTVNAVNEESAGFDEKSTWTVAPGGKIKASGSLCSGLLSKCGATKDYATYAGNKKASLNPDDDKEALGGAPYTNAASDKCTSGCDLLAESSGKHSWLPKTELLCDDSGFWETCDEGRVAKADGMTYVCLNGLWSEPETSIDGD
ncbi:MAG: hypothetical protein HY365_01240 [Candidatus Aenigmarchaeota archaeon]|nr:hypothetical protein [Candidatus Aenigmarchaeota archaeon]